MVADVSGSHVELGELRMYYESHGVGGTPLLLLHGGLFDIDQQFGALIPGLSEDRRVIAADFQGHGRTNDIERPLTSAALASDVLGLLDHLGLTRVDVFGFSIGGGVALHLAVHHPERVRRLVASSVSFHPDGNRPENGEAVGSMSVDMIAGTPMEAAYLAKSPHPDREHLQGLLDKLGCFDDGFPGWTDAQIAGITAPTLITFGDCDAFTLGHAVRFLQLRGGDVNGDFVGVPTSQLAVFPGTTHFSGLARTVLVLDSVRTFLDTPMETVMTSNNEQSFSTGFTVGNTPAEVTAAISDPRAWWMTGIVGSSEKVGDEFSFEVPGVHWSKLRVTELVPGELVSWKVIDGKVGFVADPDEWTGTEIRFEVTPAGAGSDVRFTHVGLRPADECYDACSGAWTIYAKDSLRSLLTTGTGAPGSNPDEARFQEQLNN